MHLWLALALAQDCPYVDLPEREAAERALKLSMLALGDEDGPQAWRAHEAAGRALAWLDRTEEACASHAQRE